LIQSLSVSSGGDNIDERNPLSKSNIDSQKSSGNSIENKFMNQEEGSMGSSNNSGADVVDAIE
jgi:hypothetical protein